MDQELTTLHDVTQVGRVRQASSTRVEKEHGKVTFNTDSQVPTVRRVLVVTSDRGRVRELNKFVLQRKSAKISFFNVTAYRPSLGAYPRQFALSARCG